MNVWVTTAQDEARLPEGMTRVGYDSDTGKYYFRDSDGSLWEGPEGAQYGEMVKGESVIFMRGRTATIDAELSGQYPMRPLLWVRAATATM